MSPRRVTTPVTPVSIVALVLRITTSAVAFFVLFAPTGPITATGTVVVGTVLAGAVLGGVHGWMIARVGAYAADRRGWWRLVVDHTWSLPNTTYGSVFLVLNLARGNRVDATFSAGRSSIVLCNGVVRGFATTVGPVEAGTSPRTADHEYVHVFQARLFGPLYVPLVAANYVVATLVPYWLLYHDRSTRPIRSVRDYFLRGVYPHTWHEAWAYRVQGRPP